MSAADRLAQVLAEHYEWHYAAGSDCKRIACYGCAEDVEVPDLTDLTDDDVDAAASRTFRSHLAAVVLAHLTSEGWAQGREEWGLQYERQADPTMDNPSGVVTNTMTLRDESQARGVLDSPAPISARNKRVVRRYVTDWEPVETGDQE